MTYASGTRRTEELIAAARSLSYSEQYSFTEGWDDNTVVTIMNLGLDRLYDKITQVDNVANIQEVSLNVVAQQQAYDIPIDVHMAVRIMDVRYLYGTQAYEFITLRQGMIQDRFGYPTNIPDVYCIRNGQILLSPVPNLTKNNALIINYQKRMRKLDIRRGKVASYTADGSNQNFVMTLTFSVLSQKDANLMENANSILDKIDYCTLVDRYGNAIVNAIPLNGYNQTTFALTALPTYTIPASEKAALDAALASGMIVYVVQGDYGSSHSELDRQCEDHLIEYMVLRLLRLQSAAEPTEAQMKTEEAVLDRLRWAYRRVGPSIMPIIFEQRSRPRSWPFGVRGIY